MLRLFVKFGKGGQILGVTKRDKLPAGQASGFVDVEPGTEVIEIKRTAATSPVMELEPHEIHTRYVVDIKKKTLKPIAAPTE